MLNRSRLLIRVLLLLLLCACRKENRLDCFKAHGGDKSELRLPGIFHEVEVFDKIDLLIRKGPEHSVEVIGGKNILRNIKTEVRDGRLYIDNRNTCNFVRGYKRVVKVVVTTPYLGFLKNSGVGPATVAEGTVQDTLVVRAENSGDIHINGTYNEVRTSSHGNGDIYLKGRSNSFYIYTYGTNYVHAEGLKVRSFTFVHSQTLGDCIVNADSLQRLECNIQGPGNVFYIGEPGRMVDYTNIEEYSGRIYRK